MRYEDGPAVEVEVRIAAPPERVWPLVSDIGVPPGFSGELQETRWLDADGPALGARFLGRNRHPAAGEWETISTVTECRPAECFAWAVGDPARPSATWRFEIEADEGGTLLRQRARFGPGPSGLTSAIAARPDKEERIIARRLEEHRANMTATVEGIRRLAEASS
jgi:uncharacterized protein YndB with AHSA1/START domain